MALFSVHSSSVGGRASGLFYQENLESCLILLCYEEAVVGIHFLLSTLALQHPSGS